MSNSRPRVSSHAVAAGWIVAVAVVAVAVFATPAAAATVTVSENQTIQDAIDAAEPGDAVEVPAGEYTEQLVVDKDLTLRGDSETTLNGESFDEYSDISAITITAGEVTVEGFTITGYPNDGIQYDPDAASTKQRLTVTDTRIFSNGDKAVISLADNREAAISLDGVELRDNENDAVEIDSTIGELSITDSEIVANGQTGIEGVPVAVDITDTTISRNGGWGVYLSAAESVALSDITAKANGEDSDNDNIYITEVPADGSIELSSIEATGASDHGLSVDVPQTADVSLSGIVAESNGDNGVYLDSQSATLTGITTSGNDGVGIEAMANQIRIADSQVTNNDGDGIVITGIDATITNTDVTQNGDDYGIHIMDVETVSVADSTVNRHSQSNIYIDTDVGGETIEITDVVARGSETHSGVYISSSDGSSVELSDTEGVGNDENGIYVEGGDVTATNLRASDNGNGVQLAMNGEIDLSNVTAQNNNNGVLIESLGSQGSITDSRLTTNSEHDLINDADTANVVVSNSIVGRFGDVAGENKAYIDGSVQLGAGVETANPGLQAGVGAAFTYEPTPPKADDTITFNASQSRVVGAAVESYEWDFNDDGTVDDTGQLVDKTFEEGTQPVTLTVEDTKGRTDSTTKRLEVNPSGVNPVITASKTELTVDETTVIEYSIASFLTSQESTVQMIVENPSGVQVSSTSGVDQSSNQFIAETTVSPGDTENVRINIDPNEPGEYTIEATANYESTNGSYSGTVTKTTTFTVTEPDSDAAASSDGSSEPTGDSSPGFGVVTALISVIVGGSLWRRRR